MVDPTSVPEGARDPHGALGAAAVAEYLDGGEFGPDHRLPSEAERNLIQNAIESFITAEQWLPFEHDEVELIARLRIGSSTASASSPDIGDLLVRAADALTELGQRLALQRHSREIMTDGLVSEGESLKQARLGTERTAWRVKAGPAPDEATGEIARTMTVAPEQSLSLYRVKFWRHSVTADRMSIEVAAGSPDAARARVAAWATGEIELTLEEEATEALEREELQDSSFDRLLDADDRSAVTLLGSANTPTVRKSGVST